MNPMDLATPRLVEDLQVGQWFHAQYTRESGERIERWAEVDRVIVLRARQSGALVYSVYANAPDGESVQLNQYPGHELPSLTREQARDAGLRVTNRSIAHWLGGR